MPRLFFAIELPQDIRNDLAPAAMSLRDLGAHIRPVGRGSFHLTLLFLGEQPEDILPDLKAMGSLAVSAARPSQVALGPPGFFPRVSFLTLTGEIETLAMISHALKESSRDYLERPEERPFQAHITVARHKQNIRPQEKARIGQILGPFEGRGWTCSELILFESNLTPKGPVYSILERFPFAG
jgi:2'-5' RNA ligase